MVYWFLFHQALWVSSQTHSTENSHPHSSHREGHTLICLKECYSYKKSTRTGYKKNTKKHISLGHTITDYAKPLTSFQTWNIICNNPNLKNNRNRVQTYLTTISNSNTTAGDGYFCKLLQRAHSNYPTKSKSNKSVWIRNWTFLILKPATGKELNQSWTHVEQLNVAWNITVHFPEIYFNIGFPFYWWYLRQLFWRTFLTKTFSI